VHTKCAKLVDEKNNRMFLLCKCSWFRGKYIDQRCTSYKFWKNRKFIFFL